MNHFKQKIQKLFSRRVTPLTLALSQRERERLFSCLISLIFAMLFISPAHANWQSDLTVLGVSTDLSHIGVEESWADDGDQNMYCQVRLYAKDQWEPQSVNVLAETDPKKKADFKTRCDALGQDLVTKADLHDVDWLPVDMSPPPPRIVDDKGTLLKAPSFDHYPLTQLYTYGLTRETDWEVILQTTLDSNTLAQTDSMDTASKNGAQYDIGIRPKKEPVPYIVIHGKYNTDDDQILISPVRMMQNPHYGLALLIFRDYRTGTDGLDYRSIPYFFTLPAYHIMDVDQAKNTLNRATEYAMNYDDLTRGPNVNHPGYRAMSRLKGENLSASYILDNLEQATPAGKLYWLFLLYLQAPQQYPAASKAAFNAVKGGANTVIVAHGDDWQTQSFQDVLLDQIDQLGVNVTPN